MKLLLTINPAFCQLQNLHVVLGGGVALRIGPASKFVVNHGQMTTLELSPEEAARTPLGSPVNVLIFVTVSELEALHI